MLKGCLTLKSLKVFTLLCSVLLSQQVLASSSCNVEILGAMKLDTNHLEFYQKMDEQVAEPKSLYAITNNANAYKLLINNKAITLTPEQKRLVTDYDTSIRKIVPQVKNVAIDSVDLAIEGVDVAFNDLLGEGNQLASNLTKELTLVKKQLSSSLSIEKGISFGLKDSNPDNLFGQDIEQRVKLAIEQALINSMGSILMAIGQQMMFSGDSNESMDTRLKKFTEQVEEDIALKTAKIEEKSQQLCTQIIQIDVLEGQLQSTIKPLAGINTFSVTQEHE